MHDHETCPRCGRPVANTDDYDKYDEGEGTHLCWPLMGEACMYHTDGEALELLWGYLRRCIEATAVPTEAGIRTALQGDEQ